MQAFHFKIQEFPITAKEKCKEKNLTTSGEKVNKRQHSSLSLPPPPPPAPPSFAQVVEQPPSREAPEWGCSHAGLRPSDKS